MLNKNELYLIILLYFRLVFDRILGWFSGLGSGFVNWFLEKLIVVRVGRRLSELGIGLESLLEFRLMKNRFFSCWFRELGIGLDNLLELSWRYLSWVSWVKVGGIGLVSLLLERLSVVRFDSWLNELGIGLEILVWEM